MKKFIEKIDIESIATIVLVLMLISVVAVVIYNIHLHGWQILLEGGYNGPSMVRPSFIH